MNSENIMYEVDGVEYMNLERYSLTALEAAIDELALDGWIKCCNPIATENHLGTMILRVTLKRKKQ